MFGCTKKPYNLTKIGSFKLKSAHAGEQLLYLVNHVAQHPNDNQVVDIVAEQEVRGFDVEESASHDF